jgi:peptide/nickel transport system permease protein
MSTDSPSRKTPLARGSLRWHVHMLMGSRPAMAGVVILLFFLFVVVFGDVIAPHDVREKTGPVFGPPTAEHLLGFDDGGVDMVSLVIVGTRISFLVGFAAALIATLFGGIVGLLAGYYGGTIDRLLMAVTDYFIAIPALPLMIILAALWGPDLTRATMLIGLLLWTPTARVIRAQTLSARERGFVRRAKAMGASDWWVIRKHLLPQIAGLLTASGITTLAVAVFYEAALAFFGLESATAVSWGILIHNAFAQSALSAGAWWAIVPPGVAITVLILACNLVGAYIEDNFGGVNYQPHISAQRYTLLPRRGSAK